MRFKRENKWKAVRDQCDLKTYHIKHLNRMSQVKHDTLTKGGFPRARGSCRTRHKHEKEKLFIKKVTNMYVMFDFCFICKMFFQ
jgi:hypothetical protein